MGYHTRPGRRTSPPRCQDAPAKGDCEVRMESEDVRYAAFVAAIALAFLLLIGVIYPAPLSLIAEGIILGALSGLVAVGLVLVYRANRIVNFAQGSLGALGGILAASLIVGEHWAFFPSVLAGLVAVIFPCAPTPVLFIPRVPQAPPLLLPWAPSPGSSSPGGPPGPRGSCSGWQPSAWPSCGTPPPSVPRTSSASSRSHNRRSPSRSPRSGSRSCFAPGTSSSSSWSRW